ncbi:MAG TPA: hypothetical protein VLM80_10220 [Anaerolineales bacterium]|nr:hypothetical protein [Anaerolineales bacterium]
MLKFSSEVKHLDKTICRWLIFFTILIHSAGLIQFTFQAIQQGFIPGSIRWMSAVFVNSALILLEIVLLFLCQTSFYNKIRSTILSIIAALSHLRWINLLLSLGFIAGFTYLVLNPNGRFFPIPFTRFFLFWLTAIIASLLVKAWSLRSLPHIQIRWFYWLGISFLISGFFYIIFSYFQDISSYPYTLAWSETSRYYYASLFFSEKIYGVQTTPTVLHPSRYLLQALPFLIPNSSLALHRAWQVFLWLAITLLTSFLVSKRSAFPHKISLIGLLTIMWAFIYLLIGPVYYHLQISLILVLWGFNRSNSTSPYIRFAHNLLIVAVASAWAGISRVNWFPVPGLLAATLIFIEQPIKGNIATKDSSAPYSPKLLTWTSIQYGLKTVAWTIFGTAIAYAAQNLYIYWSGNSTKDFTSSFSSDLLWYRLWPSSTYPLGILPGAILVSLPLWLLIWSKLISKESGASHWKEIHPIRLLGLFTVLLVLFAGGLVVSVKIGGGSNLHNLDAYLALLLVTTILIYLNQLVPDQPTKKSQNLDLDKSETTQKEVKPGADIIPFFQGRLSMFSLILCLIIPISLTLISRSPSGGFPPQNEIDRGLRVISRAINSLENHNKEILFLTNRHFLTFGYIQNVKLIPEYERVFLMEMAMSNNQEYLEKFHNDLANQRFGIIISEPIYITDKTSDQRFAEENNAWVKQVSEYILCYYKPRTTIRGVSIQILVPRETPHQCK